MYLVESKLCSAEHLFNIVVETIFAIDDDFSSHMMSQVTSLREKVDRELTVTQQVHRSMGLSLTILKSRHKEESIDRDTYDFADAGSLGTQLCQDLQHISDRLKQVWT